MADGSIIIDTKIDNSGAEKGVRNLRAEAAKLAHQYKKSGMDSSAAWKRAWSEIERDSKTGSGKVKNDISSIEGIARKCAAIVGGLFLLEKVKDYTSEIVKVGIGYNAMAEQSQVAWTTILGSQDKAIQMMKDIESYAAKTPFSKMGVDQMAKQLTNAGYKGQALFDQLTKFGNMGSAFGIQEDSLKEMVRQYAQVQQAQVAYTEDLNILQDRGIPIYKALGEVMGVPVSQVKKLASQGKVTADVYNKAIDSMANKTKGAMENQSKTFSGMISTLKDNLTVLAGVVSKPIFEKLKNSLQDIMPKLEKFTDLVSANGLGAAISETFPQLTPLVNMFSNLGSALANTVIPAIISFGNWVAQNIGPISFLATVIGNVVLALKAFSIINGIIAFVQGLAAVFGLLETATLGEAAAQWAANLAFLACPITWIVIAIGALVGAFIYLWTTSDGFRNFWIGLWEAVKSFFVACWDAIINFFTSTIPGWIDSIKTWFAGLPEWFGQLLDSIKNWFITKWNEIINFFTVTIPAWIESIKNWFIGIPAWFGQLWENVKQWFITKWTEIWTYLTTNIPLWISAIGQWFNELPGKIGFAIGQVLGHIIQWGINVWTYLTTNVPIWINAVVTWFAELPGRIWTWLVNTITNIVNWGQQMLAHATQIASQFITDVITYISELPGRIWKWLLDVISKVGAWGQQMWTKGTQIAGQFINNIINYISTLPSRIWQWLCNAANKVVAWGGNLLSKGREAAEQLATGVVNAVASLPGRMVELGKNIVQGVWNGITGMAGWFGDKVGDFFGGIVDGAKSVLGIHSPSRVMRDKVGKWILPGVNVGMDKSMPELQENVKAKMKDLTATMKAKVQYESSSVGLALGSNAESELLNRKISIPNNNKQKLILNIENKNYLDSEELAGHTTKKVIENISETQDSYSVSTGGVLVLG